MNSILQAVHTEELENNFWKITPGQPVRTVSKEKLRSPSSQSSARRLSAKSAKNTMQTERACAHVVQFCRSYQQTRQKR